MSCFGCCTDDNVPKAAATGPYKPNQSAGGSYIGLWLKRININFIIHTSNKNCILKIIYSKKGSVNLGLFKPVTT